MVGIKDRMLHAMIDTDVERSLLDYNLAMELGLAIITTKGFIGEAIAGVKWE